MRVAVCAGYLTRFAVSHAVDYAHASRQRLGSMGIFVCGKGVVESAFFRWHGKNFGIPGKLRTFVMRKK